MVREDWKEAALGEVCDIYQPKTISAKQMVPDGPYPVFGANGVIGRYTEFNHEEPQLLVTCRGATCGSVNMSEPFSWVTGNAMVVRPKVDDLSLRYVEYFFRGAIDLDGVITGAAQPQITRKSLAPVRIGYPPLDEQRRIVAILDEAFEGLARARTHAEANLQNARELFERQLGDCFSETPKHWVLRKLKQVTSKIGSGATPKGGAGAYKTEGISLIRSLNVHDRWFKEEKLAFIDDEQADKLINVIIEERDVLLNITGASIARCCVAPSEFLPARVNQHVSIIRPDHAVLSPKFLALMLTSKPYKDGLLKTGEDNGSTRQALTKALIENLEVAFPPDVAEQEAVALDLEAAELKSKDLAETYRIKIQDLDDLRQSLLQKAFEGELI
nr:restriction endonuclease subunit S [Ruegeria sp. HKCCA4707]